MTTIVSVKFNLNYWEVGDKDYHSTETPTLKLNEKSGKILNRFRKIVAQFDGKYSETEIKRFKKLGFFCSEFVEEVHCTSYIKTYYKRTANN